MDDVCHHGFDAGFVREPLGTDPQALPTPDLLQPLHQRGHIAGLQHQIPYPETRRRVGHIIRDEPGCSQGHGLALHVRHGAKNADAVLLAEHQIQHQHIGLTLGDDPDCLLPITGCADHLEPIRALQSPGEGGAEFFGTVRYENGGCVFHTYLSCQ